MYVISFLFNYFIDPSLLCIRVCVSARAYACPNARAYAYAY